MRTQSVIRWDSDEWIHDRNYCRSMLGGLENLGTIPPQTAFPWRKDEGSMTDEQRRHSIGHRIANRLTGGDWLDEAFLRVGRGWVASVQAECWSRDEAWWTAVGAPQAPGGGDTAPGLGEMMRRNGDRVQVVLDAIDHMLLMLEIRDRAAMAALDAWVLDVASVPTEDICEPST